MGTQFKVITRTFYLCALALLAGLLADTAGSVWAPAGFWTHLLSNGYYVGIIFAAVGFGPRGGLLAGAMAGISHVIVTVFGPSGFNIGWGEVLGFIVVGLLAGWIAQRARTMIGQMETKSKSRQNDRPGQLGFAPPLPSDHFTALGPDAPTLLHELRTPLASIEGAGFVLEDATLPEDKRQEFVAIILKECQRLDLLVGLIDASHTHFEHDELDVSSLLDEVIREAGARADAASHPLRKAPLS